MRKRGYYVTLLLNDNKFYFLKYFYNLNDAISLATKISKGLEISFNPAKVKE